MDENREKIEKLAEDVLSYSKTSLLINLRFLDMALSKLTHHVCDESTMFTNGEYLVYNPVHILKNYKLEQTLPTHDLLHVILHCVYRHMFVSPTINREVWDLACDIAVENAMNEMELKILTTSRITPQQKFIEELARRVKYMSAERIYRYFMDEEISEKDASDIRALFYADNHEMWYMTDEEIEKRFGIGKNGDGKGKDIKSGVAGSEEEWKKISERMQQEIESFSKLPGTTTGSLVQNLREVNREKYDYTQFLKKFAVRGEAMKINDDEFDYIFYTYGLELYENMPLIEPLEYKEVKRIKEFIVAIDTSGSVEGELVQAFIQKTYNILKSTESFFSKINLHIIQCDTEIKEDVKITSQEEFDEYIKSMKLRGFGGTDFRPVFEHVDTLIKHKEFTNLKGLIYFTDGFGVFPERMPGYDTAFVFINDGENNYDVPSWAIKLVLEKEEI